MKLVAVLRRRYRLPALAARLGVVQWLHARTYRGDSLSQRRMVMWRVFILMMAGLIGPLSTASLAGGFTLVPITQPKKQDGDYFKKTVTVEIRGQLEQDWLDSWPPKPGNFFIQVEGDVHYLHLKGNKALTEKAVGMLSQRVVVKATLEKDGTLTVNSIETANPVIACFVP